MRLVFLSHRDHLIEAQSAQTMDVPMKIKMLEDGKMVDFQYVVSDPDPRGNPRIYYRPPGVRKQRMREEPGSNAFAAEYVNLVDHYLAHEGKDYARVRKLANTLGVSEQWAKHLIKQVRARKARAAAKQQG